MSIFTDKQQEIFDSLKEGDPLPPELAAIVDREFFGGISRYEVSEMVEDIVEQYQPR